MDKGEATEARGREEGRDRRRSEAMQKAMREIRKSRERKKIATGVVVSVAMSPESKEREEAERRLAREVAPDGGIPGRKPVGARDKEEVLEGDRELIGRKTVRLVKKVESSISAPARGPIGGDVVEREDRGPMPSRRRITDELRRMMEEGGVSGEDLAQELALIAVQEAKKGNIKFWNAIVDRLEGKVAQRIEVTAIKAIDPSLYDQV